MNFSSQDYVLTMKINSTDFKLDLKLVFKNDKRSGNDKVEMDISYEYKGYKVGSFQWIETDFTCSVGFPALVVEGPI